MNPSFRMRGSETAIELERLYGPHGESQIQVEYRGGNLCVRVDLDEENPLGKDHLQLVFVGTVEFHIAAIPGVNTLNFEYDGDPNCGDSLGDVWECPVSEAADAWSNHFGRKIRHFGVVFTSANKSLVAFAEECRLES